ncbi:hypothetical protein Gasu2_56820 [Galdieria sulphuraria]|uniref:Uncharacterized protein n=1 Tax=Galdieria sulphuraria TaxID=130081 RepID=M2WT39_GALSU|nr:uncharacterized protein Gasu_53990 [Galdieria sulphuraria]EME27065.1 hypothetical protein Gasu_53990 [Galdieria sulphuraria]GJD11548.1 hypothetical protein Gasu2_56820 [Galdieria sulphuraria]|eukprot:XP_005703585.1 hypothetical protein Gasu_53990 [Galdieria sulphuraria]
MAQKLEFTLNLLKVPKPEDTKSCFQKITTERNGHFKASLSAIIPSSTGHFEKKKQSTGSISSDPRSIFSKGEIDNSSLKIPRNILGISI